MESAHKGNLAKEVSSGETEFWRNMAAPRDIDGRSAGGGSSGGASVAVRGSTIPLGRRRAKLNPLYGKLVGGLKVLLPTVAVALVLLAAAWPFLSEQNSRFATALTGADRRAAENLEVQSARYSGVEGNGQPFTVTAESMQQKDVESDIVNLDQPKADILLSNGSWVAVTAASGIMNRSAQVLELTKDVNLFHDLGYEFRTERAVLDLQGGSASGDEPVYGQGPFGFLEAEGFRVTQRGARVKLTGKSKVVIYPNAGGDS